MSEMFLPKTIKNLVILLQVPVSNVTDGFWRLSFILTLISCVLIYSGSAETCICCL